jgi:hypothetical protein
MPLLRTGVAGPCSSQKRAGRLAGRLILSGRTPLTYGGKGVRAESDQRIRPNRGEERHVSISVWAGFALVAYVVVAEVLAMLGAFKRRGR